MTTSEILNYLRGYTTLNLSERRMGEALKKAGSYGIQRIGGNPMYWFIIYARLFQIPLFKVTILIINTTLLQREIKH